MYLILSHLFCQVLKTPIRIFFFFSICRYRNRCQEKVKRLLKDANLVYDEIRIQIQSWLNPKALCVEKNGKFGKQERGVEGI